MRRLAIAVLVALPLFAQVTEKIDVALTSIDVVVTDGKGNRVRGLTKADFEVFEDGKRREITNFTEYTVNAPAVSGATASVATAAPVSATAVNAPPRRLMILFDGNTLTPQNRRITAEAAAKFIDQHVRPTDQAMIAVLSQAFTPRSEWTSDRAELKRVVSAIGAETTSGAFSEERKRADEQIEHLIELAASSVGSSMPPPTFEDLVRVGRNYAEKSLQDTRSLTALLGTVVGQLGKFPEKKALILIGEGLESRPGWDIFQKLETIKSGGRPSPGIEVILRSASRLGSPLLEAGRHSAAAVFAQLANTAYRNGVPIYAINPGTSDKLEEAIEKYGAPPDPAENFASYASKFIGYDLVAVYSGGAQFAGGRTELALGQVAADLGGYYSIAFRASAAPRDAGAIRVRTKARHTVRASLATAAPVELADSVTEAVTAHHVVAPASNELEIALETGEIQTAGDKQKVKLNVIIPIRNLSLARQGSEVTGGFDVYLSVSDGRAYFSPVIKQAHAIKWPADSVAEDDERTMTYSIEVTLQPGTSQISVGVVDHGSQKTGFERIAM